MKNRKKDKTPFLLKFVRWFFPKLERIAPPLAHRYFVKVFFTPLRYPIPEKEIEVLNGAARTHLFIEGKKVQVYVWGHGTEVVWLVHGWAGRAGQFRKFVGPLLDAGFKVVAFDGPAHGFSEGKTTNIIEFESLLKKLHEQMGAPHGVIAHSFGGGAALYATMNGLPIKRLVNIASPTIGDEIIKTYLRTINGTWSTGMFFKNYMLNTFGKTFDEFTSLHFIQHLPIPLQLLLMYDTNDRDVTLDHARALIQLYPSAKLIETQGLGHTRILKDEHVIQQVVTFLLESRRARDESTISH